MAQKDYGRMSSININDETEPKVKAKKRLAGQTVNYWGTQVFGGYPGLKNSARVIAEYIPGCRIYVEPFAGVASVGDFVQPEFIKVYNDISPTSRGILKKKNQFNPYVHISNLDFKACLKEWDAPDTFFLIDPPWEERAYKNNRQTRCDQSIVRYYQTILYEVLYLKGNWILCSGINGPGANIIKRSPWQKKVVYGKKNSIFGCTPKTLLCSNMALMIRNPVNERLEKFA